jgi:hypothetical protein
VVRKDGLKSWLYHHRLVSLWQSQGSVAYETIQIPFKSLGHLVLSEKTNTSALWVSPYQMAGILLVFSTSKPAGSDKEGHS